MNIDAKNKILGRIATVAAKQAILGETVNIVNCEQAIITGNREMIFREYKQTKDRGHTHRAPYISRLPDRMVRRAIRGMLPHKQPKGVAAMKRIRCYIGMPETFSDKQFMEMPKASLEKLPNFKYVTIKEICNFLGGKV